MAGSHCATVRPAVDLSMLNDEESSVACRLLVRRVQPIEFLAPPPAKFAPDLRITIIGAAATDVGLLHPRIHQLGVFLRP